MGPDFLLQAMHAVLGWRALGSLLLAVVTTLGQQIRGHDAGAADPSEQIDGSGTRSRLVHSPDLGPQAFSFFVYFNRFIETSKATVFINLHLP